MATKRLPVELPDALWEALGPDDRARAAQAKEALVLELVRRKEISAGYGAELLGIHLTDFVKVMLEHAIPYFTEPPQDPEQLNHLLEKGKAKARE